MHNVEVSVELHLGNTERNWVETQIVNTEWNWIKTKISVTCQFGIISCLESLEKPKIFSICFDDLPQV